MAGRRLISSKSEAPAFFLTHSRSTLLSPRNTSSNGLSCGSLLWVAEERGLSAGARTRIPCGRHCRRGAFSLPELGTFFFLACGWGRHFCVHGPRIRVVPLAFELVTALHGVEMLARMMSTHTRRRISRDQMTRNPCPSGTLRWQEPPGTAKNGKLTGWDITLCTKMYAQQG